MTTKEESELEMKREEDYCKTLEEPKREPKILIAAPIAGEKQYSMGLWLDWIANQTYKNYDVCLCVNGEHRMTIADKLQDTSWTDVHGNEKKPKIIEMPDSDDTSMIQNLCYARQFIFDYAIEKNYDYIFFMDTDTIPHFKDTIQILLDQKKDYISGLYFYKQSPVPVAISKVTNRNFTTEELKELVNTQAVVKTWGTGYGCLLLSKKSFSVPILYEKWKESRTDDFNHCEQLLDAKIDLWFMPYLMCMHLGKDLKLFEVKEGA